MTELILHALDLAMMREYDRAKALLEPIDEPVAGRLFLLICELEQGDQLRERTLQFTRHEIGNALSIAQANLEGMADGVVDVSARRIEAVLDSLKSAGALLDDLRRLPERGRPAPCDAEEFLVTELLEGHISAVAGLARAKNVRIAIATAQTERRQRGDRAQVSRMVRKAVIDAVRYAPPGGSVDVSLNEDASEAVFTIRDASARASGELQRVIKLHLPVEAA